MKERDVEPAHLPSGSALRKMKSRNELGTLSGSDPMINLSNMKKNEYKECIQDIWISPFVVHNTIQKQKITIHQNLIIDA